MLALQIVVRVEGVIARLDLLSRRLQDTRPEMLRTVDQILSIEATRFASDDQLAHHRRLMRSLTERDAPYQVLAVGSDRLTLGTRVRYPHFRKTTRDGKPIVGLTRIEASAVRGEFKRQLLEGL